MSILERNMSFFFNSAEQAGARKIGSLGNRFAIQLLDPISIPERALYATLEITSAQIWNTSPNVSSQIGNNKFYITYNATPYTITIDDGLYGVAELEAYLQREFISEGLPDDLIVLSGDDSTQRTVITFNYLNTTIDFNPADSCRDVLGFDAGTVSATVIGESIYSDNQAAFNRVNSYYIKSNILSTGIPQNKFGTGIIAGVPIDVQPGSQITYSPRHPLRANADELIGKSKQYLEFTLLDQLERDVSTNGEEWSFTLVLRYWIAEKPLATQLQNACIPYGASTGLL